MCQSEGTNEYEVNTRIKENAKAPPFLPSECCVYAFERLRVEAAFYEYFLFGVMDTGEGDLGGVVLLSNSNDKSPNLE